jgi:hypothetical protein
VSEMALPPPMGQWDAPAAEERCGGWRLQRLRAVRLLGELVTEPPSAVSGESAG